MNLPPLSFRAKLLLMVATFGVALVLVILVSTLIGLRETAHMHDVEGRLLPKAEVGPQIEADFERLRRGLHDAAAAQDAEMLADTHAMVGQLTRRITGARAVLDPRQADAALAAIEAYYQNGYDLTRRMVAGETGEAIVEAVAVMQNRQAAAEAAVKAAATLDRAELTQHFEAIREARRAASRARLAIGITCLLLVLGLSIGLSRSVLRVLGEMSAGFARFGRGDFSQPIAVPSHDEIGAVAREANQMAESLERLGRERDAADWLKTGLAKLGDALRGELEPDEAADRALQCLTSYLNAPASALYFVRGGETLELLGHSGLDDEGAPGGPRRSFAPGEGLVGQAALGDEIREIEVLPENYLRVRSGLGEAPPRSLVLVPLSRLGKTCGVLELALWKPLAPLERELLAATRETLVIAIEVALARTETRELLAETQRQAQRLGAQEQELRANNEELQAQQEELRQINDELDAQRVTLEEKNTRLAEAQRSLEQKAAELTLVSAYKSRFLANMSHELRTPLNSMLILSELLAQNDGGNLTEKQVEYCRTVHSAGRDLLALINQVLDLSKIEAGKQQVHLERVAIADVAGHLKRLFEPMAAEKGIAFSIELAPGLPSHLVTDRQRLEQVLTNLLGNALKFTAQGQVALTISPTPRERRLRRRDLQRAQERGGAVSFAVSDTGPGIAKKDQDLIFTPFERLETKADVRYGSTGLGLTIARELVALLGGELHLESEVGKGSTFTCHLPVEADAVETAALPPAATATVAPAPLPSARPARARVPDDRETIGPQDSSLLVIEDDPVFAERLIEIIHARGFKALAAPQGDEGLELARKYQPAGVILDVRLPDVSGWTVMDRLRRDPSTESIPVHFVTAVDSPDRGWALGAIGYLTKPASNRELIEMVQALAPRPGRPSQEILVLEDDADTGASLISLLETDGLRARQVTTAAAAFAALVTAKKNGEQLICLILDLGLPDMDGLGFLEELRARDDLERPPVIVYTGRALTRDETRRIEAYAEAVVLKQGRSGERLLEEIRLFIHHLEDRLPRERKPRPVVVPPNDQVFRGKRLLVVDDDMRTVYALSALLRTKGVDVLMADTGRAALEQLGRATAGKAGVDAIIMDVMMPEMDGYEAMRRIRSIDRFTQLPIIALTAKAMKGEREKCLEAGASDYLSKPIDSAELLTLLSSWLERGEGGAGRPDGGN